MKYTKVGGLLVFLFALCSFLFSVYVIQYGYIKFLIPLGLPFLSYSKVVAIMVLYSFLSSRSSSQKERDMIEDIKRIIYDFVSSSFYLFIMCILSFIV
jgi:hypothetical protein